jgi:hypothetical protein
LKWGAFDMGRFRHWEILTWGDSDMGYFDIEKFYLVKYRHCEILIRVYLYVRRFRHGDFYMGRFLYGEILTYIVK